MGIKKIPLPSLRYLKQLFSYDPKSGTLRWLAPRGGRYVGHAAGSLDRLGYRQVMIDGTLYMSHRIIWLMTYGVAPTDEIDHINGKRSDNKLKNLRQSTRAGNCANRKIPKNNSSGYKGACFHKRVKKWIAQINRNGRRYHIGVFDTAAEAHAAYVAEATKIYGKFARAK